MSGNFPVPGRSKTVRQALYECLQVYLEENKEKLFLDLVTMTEALQKKKPQFARIRKDVFSGIVQQAYQKYTSLHPPPPEAVDIDPSVSSDTATSNSDAVVSVHNGASEDDEEDNADDVTVVPYSMTMNKQIQQLYEPGSYGYNSSGSGRGRPVQQGYWSSIPPPQFPGIPSNERPPFRAPREIIRPSISQDGTDFGYIPPEFQTQSLPPPRRSTPFPGIAGLGPGKVPPQPPPAPTGIQMKCQVKPVQPPLQINIDQDQADRVPIRRIGISDKVQYNTDDLTRPKPIPIRQPPPKSPSLLDPPIPIPNVNFKDSSGSEELQFLKEVKTPKKPAQHEPQITANGHKTPMKKANDQSTSGTGAEATGTHSHKTPMKKAASEQTPSEVASTNTGAQGQKRKTDSSESGLEDFNNARKKAKKEQFPVVLDPGVSFEDFGGSEKVLEEISRLLLHLKHPEMYRSLGVVPPRGFILHGPPGCGKTLLANAIAGELGIPMIKMAATELISGISGESESNIRELFDQAVATAPCIIFIDEIDSITPKRETAQREMERRIVAQLLACIDELLRKEKGDQVLLIGATNRIDTIDIALRRAGRFDREICLGIPDIKAREKILRVICKSLKLEEEFNYEKLAQQTPGYVGADLQALVREAAVISVSEILEEPIPVPLESKIKSEETTDLSSLDTSMVVDDDVEIVEEIIVSPEKVRTKWLNDSAPLTETQLLNFRLHLTHFEKALKNVQPSSKREGFATVPDITWDDIGALKDIRDELQVSILGPVKHMAEFQELGLDSPAGVLLCGPPGCGKTLLAKAVANEAGINFISVKGPELLNMYVGESERAVRQCFQRAKNSSPCVIFFDELDALCPRRSDGGTDSGSSSRVVNQLLTEMDGMESRIGVFVMAATNRPDIVDPAILRPGRLDKILFVNLPTESDRIDIFKAITKNGTKPMMGPDVDLSSIATSCENFTGADLSSLVREASIASFREFILDAPEPKENEIEPKPRESLKVYARHFEIGFGKTKPSVSQLDRQKYDRMKEKYSTSKSQ